MATPEEEMEKLEARYQRGEISYDELVSKGNFQSFRLVKMCKHAKTSVESFKNGSWIEWCEDCSARLSSGGSGKMQPKAKSSGFCSLVLLALLGSLVATVYGTYELVAAVL